MFLLGPEFIFFMIILGTTLQPNPGYHGNPSMCHSHILSITWQGLLWYYFATSPSNCSYCVMYLTWNRIIHVQFETIQSWKRKKTTSLAKQPAVLTDSPNLRRDEVEGFSRVLITGDLLKSSFRHLWLYLSLCIKEFQRNMEPKTNASTTVSFRLLTYVTPGHAPAQSHPGPPWHTHTHTRSQLQPISQSSSTSLLSQSTFSESSCCFLCLNRHMPMLLICFSGLWITSCHFCKLVVGLNGIYGVCQNSFLFPLLFLSLVNFPHALWCSCYVLLSPVNLPRVV